MTVPGPPSPAPLYPATGAGDLETVWRAELSWAQVTFITSSESLPQQFPGWRHWRHRPGDKAPVCAGCGDGGHRPLTFLNWPRKPAASGSPALPSSSGVPVNSPAQAHRSSLCLLSVDCGGVGAWVSALTRLHQTWDYPYLEPGIFLQ